MSDPVVVTNGLCKSYGDKRVLDRVNLCVPAAKLVGFLGPNGAGKTTTLRIMLGLLKPTSGSAHIFGLDCHRQGRAIRQRVGFLPGDVNLYPSMSGAATLKFLARTRKTDCGTEFDRLSQRFELPLNRKVRKYSTGMRQKLGLIQALMHQPDLLVLDEPTSALDPLVRTVLFEELRHVVQQGRTVLFSSHSLGEVEELCDEVIILRSGRIVEQQNIDVLRSRALRKVTLFFSDPAHNPQTIPEPVSHALQIIQRDQHQLQMTFSGEITQLLNYIQSLEVQDVMIEKPDLNDLFLTYYQEQVV